MIANLKRPLRWLVAIAVLAGGLALPLGGAAPARAGELQKIDRELNELIKKKRHHKKHHHKKHHHKKKKKKTASIRGLERQLDNQLNRILAKK